MLRGKNLNQLTDPAEQGKKDKKQAGGYRLRAGRGMKDGMRWDDTDEEIALKMGYQKYVSEAERNAAAAGIGGSSGGATTSGAVPIKPMRAAKMAKKYADLMAAGYSANQIDDMLYSYQTGGYPSTGNPELDLKIMQNQYIAGDDDEDVVEEEEMLLDENGNPIESDKGFKGYAKMLNKVPQKYKDKAASWMYIYDAKGNPVLPGKFPMITPGMIKKNLEKNQWLRMRYEAWRDDKRRMSLKNLLPKT